jgi:hypothetical protein
MSNVRHSDDAGEFIRDCVVITLVAGTVMALLGCAAGFIVGLALIFRRNIANMVLGGRRG